VVVAGWPILFSALLNLDWRCSALRSVCSTQRRTGGADDPYHRQTAVYSAKYGTRLLLLLLHRVRKCENDVQKALKIRKKEIITREGAQ